MHFVMIVGSLCLAWGLRYGWQNFRDSWQLRWQKALFCFVLPPMLVITTAIALLCMGADGQMIGMEAGRFSYAIALIFVIYSIFRCGQLAWGGYQAWQNLQNLIADSDQVLTQVLTDDLASEPLDAQDLGSIKLLNIAMPFAAQIGFWRSHLFVSQGLLDHLDRPHLQAVILHERAHAHYRDTFWFYGLGCLRQIMPWLPHTQALWEELLLLREMRADRWAAQYVDGLLLAESLLAMVSYSLNDQQLSSESTASPTFVAAFGANTNNMGDISDRLEERINFLLDAPEPLPQFDWRSLLWLGLCLLPLSVLPLHS